MAAETDSIVADAGDQLKKPEKVVSDIGKQLAQQSRHTSDFLVKKLRQAATALSELKQLSSLEPSIRPLKSFLVKQDLLHHENKDVKLWVAVCFCEIIRILAPNPSFHNKTFKGIFELFISIFMELSDTTSAYFPRRVKILETVAMLQCCRKLLDLGCGDLVLEMFKVLFAVVRDKHQQSLIDGMLSIMSLIMNEEETPRLLLEVVLHNLINKEEGPAPASCRLAVALIQNCAEKIKPAICRFLTSCILDRENVTSDLKESYHDIIFHIFQCVPDMLIAIIPNLIQELVADQVDVRMKSVNLIVKLLALPKRIHEFHFLFVEFLKRFSDKSAGVRASATRAIKTFYMANPSRIESHEILSSLEARLLDFDASVRIEAVTVVCDLAIFNLKNFPDGLIARAIDRLRDKMTSVRKEALRKLLEVYCIYCTKCSDGQMAFNDCYEQIPCKILMFSFDKNLKEFRPQGLEILLAERLFPESLSVEDRTRHWIHLYSLFTPAHIKALSLILCQKGRFQKEMKGYLSLRRKEKPIDGGEVNMKIKNAFTRMSAAFSNPLKAEDSFSELHELKESSIFDLLLQQLEEPAFLNAKALRDKFLEKIREKHLNFEFMKLLSLKSSNSVFGSEHVCYILDHVSGSRCTDDRIVEPSVNLLSDISRNFPVLFRGSEHQLKQLILQDFSPMHRKLIQILANASSFISMEVSEIYPILEHLCLSGTRAEAKFAISVIAALVSPSEHFHVEYLCQKLVSALWADRNIPTVFQSLGCISQHFVSEFQKHGNEVSSFITKRIFEERTTKDAVQFKEISGCEVSYGCTLKVYGLKALVKSVLPKKEVLGKEQISNLLDILSKVLLSAKFSDQTTACEHDVSFMKLAAAKAVLHLSRRWDLHIPPQIFQSTIMIVKETSCAVRRAFLAKVHKSLKEHAIPIKFACAFALVAASDCVKDLKKASLEYLVEFIKAYGRAGPGCPTSSTEEFSTNCATYIVVFLLHVLAHDAGFPPLNSTNEELWAQFCRPLVLILYLFVDVQFVYGDMDLVKKNFMYLRSIFQAVKRAEAAIDSEMTRNLHILADIGVSILNVLKHDGIDLAPVPGLVLLPSSLFKVAPMRTTEEKIRTSGLDINQHFVRKLVEVFELDFTRVSSTTSKRTRKCLKDSLQDPNIVDLGVPKHSELFGNVITQEKVAEKDMAESHILEACIRGEEHTKVGHSSLGTSQLEDVSSAIEEFDTDASRNSGVLSANDKFDSNSGNVKLFGTVSDVSTQEVTLSLPQVDERKRKDSCASVESPKLSKTKLRHSCISDGSTVSLLQQRDSKKQRLGDNVKANISGLGGTAAKLQGTGESKQKVLLDRTNTLAGNGLHKHSQSIKGPRISVDNSASDVSDVGNDAIAFRTRRRKG